MPAGATSLQPFTPTIYTAQVASTYKSNIDGNSSVVSNFSGRLYVYPNNPAGLSVLVDPAYNLLSLGGAGLNGGPILFNTAASAATVSLTAPSANSYYATIYWNPNANTAGVVYGATSATPFPILPDDSAFQVLACVLLTTGQSQVQANNIYDVRNFWSFAPYRYYNASIGANFTVNCAGASSIHIEVTVSANITATLQNLQVGIPLFISAGSSGANHNLLLTVTTPGGVAYSLFYKQTICGTVAYTAGSLFAGIPAGNNYCMQSLTHYRAATPVLIQLYN